MDHFVTSVKGRKFDGFDRGSDANRFCGGCIFVDHASSYIHVEAQTSLTSHDTLRAKSNFENLCRDSGVAVPAYTSDNGKSFTSTEYTDHLFIRLQNLQESEHIIRMLKPSVLFVR